MTIATASGVGPPFTDPARTFNYLPWEICIAVSENTEITGVDPSGGGKSSGDRQAQAVADFLNGTVRPFLPRPLGLGSALPTPPANPDLAPSADVWNDYRVAPGAPALFTRIVRPNGRPSAYFTRIDAAVAFSTISLHFFDVNLLRPPTADSQRARAETIRELVMLINTQFAGGKIPEDDPRMVLLAATPHWLTGAAPGNDIDPSPGTPPEPLTIPEAANTHPLHFAGGALPAIIGGTLQGLAMSERNKARTPGSSGVVVAVLDTCPQSTDFDQAVVNHGENRLLQQAAGLTDPFRTPYPAKANAVQVDNPVFFKEEHFAHLADWVPNHRGGLKRWYDAADDAARADLKKSTYATADHGLFVAGIIKEIAPRAEIHVIRVMDRAGVGDLHALACALEDIVAWKRSDSIRKMIVNLSLTIAVPQRAELAPYFFPQTIAGGAMSVGDVWAAFADTLERTHLSVHSAIDWLRENGVLVVAAAGNNALGKAANDRPEPCVPARYDTALCVAAVNRALDPARFSNEGEDGGIANGIATLGGDADLVTGLMGADPPTAKITGAGALRDAVRGIFSAPTITANRPPGAGVNNGTGWVWWAGTSFATPIISAVAANLWALGHQQANSPAAIIAVILGINDKNEGPLGVNAIAADQDTPMP